MDTLVLTLHVVVCIILIGLVLLQSGKEGMGVIFGGGSSSLFGGSGAGGILVKITAFLAVMFIITSLSYNVMTSGSSTQQSVVDKIDPVNIDEAPAPPTAPQAQTEVPVTPPAANATAPVQ